MRMMSIEEWINEKEWMRWVKADFDIRAEMSQYGKYLGNILKKEINKSLLLYIWDLSGTLATL